MTALVAWVEVDSVRFELLFYLFQCLRIPLLISGRLFRPTVAFACLHFDRIHNFLLTRSTLIQKKARLRLATEMEFAYLIIRQSESALSSLPLEQQGCWVASGCNTFTNHFVP